MEKLVLQPRKDRYNPDNVYRIYIHIGNHPGAKWVSFKDKATGEVTKGIFIPDVETGGIRIRNGNVKLEINAIPVSGQINTHVLVPAVSGGVDCGLGMKGKKIIDFKKAVIGNMYVMGEYINEDQKRIINEYIKRKRIKVGRYKKDRAIGMRLRE